MIALLLAASAAELQQESEAITGAEVRLALTVESQRAMLQITNLGATPIVVDWEGSSVTPIGGTEDNLVPGGPDRPLAGVLVAPAEIAAGATLRVRPIPRTWIDDGEANDAEQWASWDNPGTVSVTLALEGADGVASASATWRQGPTTDVPLAIPATVVPTLDAPVAEPDALELASARAEWALKYRNLRRQDRIARTLWVAGVVAGGVCGLTAITAARAVPGAPVVAAEGETSRADLVQRSRTFGVVSGLGFAVAVPTMVWDFSTRKKRKQLGPRP